MKAIGFGERLLCMLFPARCILCGELVYPEEIFCAQCAKELPEKPYRRQYEGFSAVSPLLYAGEARKAMHRLKFQGERDLARPMGRLLAQTAEEALPPIDCVVWAPMSATKKRKRGYDQSELLAKSAAKALGLPCLPVLYKARETEIQHELSRSDREQNVKNAYGARDNLRDEISGRRVLLIDDIVTTGATLRECVKVLYAAGAKSVAAACVTDAIRTKREEETE